MNDSELRASAPPTTWDNSMRCMFKACPRRFYYWLRGFTYDPARVPTFFTWGRAFHQGLSSWYTYGDTLPGTEAHQVRVLTAIDAAVRKWRDEGGIDNKLDSEENLRTKLLNYFLLFPREPWHFVPGGAEAGWQWPLPGTSYMLGGAIDGYAEWPGYGLFFVEHKSTSAYLSDNYVKQWYFSSQIIQYSWYLRQLHTEEEVYGGLLNLVTKNIKSPRSKWTTNEYERILVKKTALELAEFEEDFRQDLQTFERCWTNWYWPMSATTSPIECTGGIGKSRCLFVDVCLSRVPFAQAQPSIFDGIVESNERWEPWNRTEES